MPILDNNLFNNLSVSFKGSKFIVLLNGNLLWCCVLFFIRCNNLSHFSPYLSNTPASVISQPPLSPLVPSSSGSLPDIPLHLCSTETERYKPSSSRKHKYGTRTTFLLNRLSVARPGSSERIYSTRLFAKLKFTEARSAKFSDIGLPREWEKCVVTQKPAWDGFDQKFYSCLCLCTHHINAFSISNNISKLISQNLPMATIFSY